MKALLFLPMVLCAGVASAAPVTALDSVDFLGELTGTIEGTIEWDPTTMVGEGTIALLAGGAELAVIHLDDLSAFDEIHSLLSFTPAAGVASETAPITTDTDVEFLGPLAGTIHQLLSWNPLAVEVSGDVHARSGGTDVFGVHIADLATMPDALSIDLAFGPAVAVPEPLSMLLVGSTLIGLVGWRRARR